MYRCIWNITTIINQSIKFMSMEFHTSYYIVRYCKLFWKKVHSIPINSSIYPKFDKTQHISYILGNPFIFHVTV